MNPFRPNLSVPVTEQDLLALHLNELPPGRARAVRRAVKQDPALHAESASIAAMLAAMSFGAGTADQPSPVLSAATLDRNWQAIRPGLDVQRSPISRQYLPTLAGALLAATAGIALMVYSHQRNAPKPAPHDAVVEDSQLGTSREYNLPAANPQTQTGTHAKEPGFRANLKSGVYYSPPSQATGPVHLLGLVQSTPVQRSPSSTDPGQLTQPFESFPQPASRTAPSSTLAFVPPAGPVTSTPAQTADSARTDVHLARPHLSHPVDLMLGIGGTFVPEHDSLTAGTEPRTLAVTHAIVALGSVHQQFRPAVGYRVTLSYSRPELSYTYSSGSGSNGFSYSGAINTRIFEAAGTYVVQGPHRHRLSTSADAGAALLAFLPTNAADPTTSYGYRAAGVFGINFDYRITKRLGARLGYRAQVFRSPNFRYSGGTIPVTTPLIVDNEPSLGVTYRFGKP